jgi:hypothetical protein
VHHEDLKLALRKLPYEGGERSGQKMNVTGMCYHHDRHEGLWAEVGEGVEFATVPCR